MKLAFIQRVKNTFEEANVQCWFPNYTSKSRFRNIVTETKPQVVINKKERLLSLRRYDQYKQL